MTGRGQRDTSASRSDPRMHPRPPINPLESECAHLLPTTAEVVPCWAWPCRQPATKSPGFRALLKN